MSFLREICCFRRASSALLFWIGILIPFSLLSQDCNIISEIEPSATTDYRFPFNASVSACSSDTSHWDIQEKVFLINENYTSVTLASGDLSSCITFNDLNFNLPYGAKINGIKVEIQGYTDSLPNIESLVIQLVNKNGEISGQNKAGIPSVGQEWTNDVWKYGHGNDLWKNAWSYEDINDPDFGVMIQIQNTSESDSVSAFIDGVKITVNYTPLFSLCDHDCFAFYLTDVSADQSVNWILPAEFEFRSYSQNKDLVNIGIGEATFGHYNICVEIIEGGEVVDLCCREMTIDNCQPASIGDFVWQDANGDGIQNPDELGFPGIDITLFDIKFNEIASTTTDDFGKYEFQDLDEGTYVLSFESLDEFFFSPTTIDVSDAENSDITNTFGEGSTGLIFIPAGNEMGFIDVGYVESGAVGDFVWEDLNANGIYDDNESGLAGVTISLFDQDDKLLETTQTNADGNYIFQNLRSGDFVIKIEAPGYQISPFQVGSNPALDNDFNPLGFTNSIAIDQGEKNFSIDAGLYKYAKVGDFVWLDENKNGIQDPGEKGIPEVEVSLFDVDQNLVKTAITGKEGFYILDQIIPGVYFLSFDIGDEYIASAPFIGLDYLDSDITGFFGNNTTDNFKLTSHNNNYDIDAGFYPALGSITGKVWEDLDYNGNYADSEILLPSNEVALYDDIGNLIAQTSSDNEGNYAFDNIEPGMYYVQFNIPNGFLSTINEEDHNDTNSDITNENGNGTTSLLEVVAGGIHVNIDGGIVGYASLGDFVWLDMNENGLQDDDEGGVNGITINLFNESNELISSLLSDQNVVTGKAGYYQFNNLLPGDYYFQFDIAADLFTTAFAGSDPSKDSDLNNENGPGTTSWITLQSSQEKNDIDAGLLFQRGEISGLTWIDKNGDGIRKENELPSTEILVQLFSNGDLIATTFTDANGQYSFTDLLPGIYYLIFEEKELHVFTDAFAGAFDDDSDVTSSITFGSTNELDLSQGQAMVSVDAGYVPINGSIGDRVWLDNNADGIQDESEPGLADVQVFLFGENNILVGSMITNEDGYYLFENLLPGNYFILFKTSPEYNFTKSKIGNNGNFDSDVTNSISTGTTDLFTLQFFENKTDIDAGVFQLSGIGDFVWFDENKDGLQQETEEGINGISLDLYDELGNFIFSTQTQNHPDDGSPGFYSFNMISPGPYKILIELPEGFAFTNSFAGNEDQDSDIANIVDNTGATSILIVPSGISLSNIDFGLIPNEEGTAAIGNFIWHDLNIDGIQQEGEPGVNGIQIILFSEFGQELDQTKSSNHPETNESGFYQFRNLDPGNYYVTLALPFGMQLSMKNSGSDPEIDSDFALESGELRSSIIGLSDGEINNEIDAGLTFELSRIGDRVWLDENQNGVQDEIEMGINEIEIKLFTANGEEVAAVFSGNGNDQQPGFYAIENVLPGSYYVQFIMPEGYQFTSSDLGGNDTKDSDVTNSNGTGTTNIFSVGSGETDFDIDAGLFRSGFRSGDFDAGNKLKIEINIAPNPFYRDLHLHLHSNKNEKVKLSIVDIMGQSLYQQIIDIKDNAKIINLGLDDLPSGTYILRIITQDKTWSQTIIKQRL